MAHIFTGLDEFPQSLRGGAVAVGNFDGVHRGHACLIQELLASAQAVKGPAIVLTFDPPPVAVLVPSAPPSPPLTSIQRRAELLGLLGVDVLIAYPTDRELLKLNPQEFFDQVILKRIGARAMVEGPNFRFGRDRLGDTRILGQLCRGAGTELRVVPATSDDSGSMISSTRIRELLSGGAVDRANLMLTRPYRIDGIVTKGAQRGRELGFPTANLENLSCFLPGHGVYAGSVHLQGADRPAAIHIGPNPTFGERHAKVEVHVIGWSGNIYGERLACNLIKKVRDVRQFDSAQELKMQLRDDVAACANLLEAERQIGSESN